MSAAFIARQPIFNPKLDVVGYELLFRGRGYAAGALIDDAERATATVVLNTLTELDMGRIVAGKTAWVNVTREFGLDDLIQAVPPSVVGLEIPETEVFDAEMVDALRELKDAGYRLALDDFRYRDGSEAVLELFDVVKLSMPELGRQQMRELTARLRPFPGLVLADKLGTRPDHEVCIAAGCDLFQGYFFCRPAVVGTRGIAANRLALLQVVAALNDPAVQFSEIEQLTHPAASLHERLADVLGQRERRDDIVHRRVHHGVDHRKESKGEQLGGAADPGLAAGQLAEPGADQRREGQFRGLIVNAGQRAQRGPAPHVLQPEQGERLPDRPNIAAQAEVGRVDVAQEAEAERHVARHQLLDLGELHRRVVERGDDLEQCQPVGRDPARADHRRAAEEVALEQVAAGSDAHLVIGSRSQLVGQDQAWIGAQAGGELAHLLAAEVGHAELDHVEQLEDRVGAIAVAEVVERQPVAGVLELA